MRSTRHFLALAIGLVTACAPTHVVSTPTPALAPGDRIRYADRSDTTEFVVARFVALNAEKLVFQRYVADSGRTITRSVPTDSVAGLQVRVGRRSNAARGALFGGLAGVAIGILCASEPGEWVTGEQCLVGYTLLGYRAAVRRTHPQRRLGAGPVVDTRTGAGPGHPAAGERGSRRYRRPDPDAASHPLSRGASRRTRVRTI